MLVGLGQRLGFFEKIRVILVLSGFVRTGLLSRNYCFAESSLESRDHEVEEEKSVQNSYQIQSFFFN